MGGRWKLAIGGLCVIGAVSLDLINPRSVWDWTTYSFFRAGDKVTATVTERKTGNVANARICRQNLQRIQAAKRKAGQDRGQPIGKITWEEMLIAMHPGVNQRLLPQSAGALIPKCPEGGTYSLGTLEEVPRCSILGNGSTAAEDDHAIRN